MQTNSEMVADPDDSSDSHAEGQVELSVVIPCLNEAETIGGCIEKALQALKEHNIRGEVVIADNGSSDDSAAIATGLGARVIPVQRKGYGSALMGGIEAAAGKFVIMGDADGSYDFLDIPKFVEKLRDGFDLVMGNRFQGGIKPGAMPALHRYLGNPVLTGIGRLFFRSPCGDFQCGLRGFRRGILTELDLRTTGMEFASEMVVKATLHELRICEIPTTLSPDGRSHPPHLRSWRDGWRNLVFMLIYSPRWLFFLPGVALMAVGTLAMFALILGTVQVGRVGFDVHTMVYSAAAILIGFQSVLFAALSKIFAVTSGLVPVQPIWDRFFRRFSLETGLVVGAILVITGIAGSLIAVWVWSKHNFGGLDARQVLRLVIPAAVAITLGFQIVLGSFFATILSLGRR